ncbi:hypothetical protein NDU88_004152 [Pleurodeles waltl]|uniref:Uncharacterized protein n=1 Tax=Pleurodeles waltl TaxID=8319 RepID=A0AAV7RKN5_PLEWA|nr:hypothetical protein NDU88_004152 [Pleurodeles waltl]
MGPGSLPSLHLVFIRLQSFVVVDERSHRLGASGGWLLTLFPLFPLPERECLSPARGPGVSGPRPGPQRRSRCAGPPSQRPPVSSAPMESQSAAHSTQRAGIHNRRRVLSPLQGAPQRAARSTSASPIPAAAILHRCYFRRGRDGDPARPAPSPQSMFRHLSKASVRSAAPAPSLVSPGAPVQSGRVWGPGLQPRRGGSDPLAILFWFGRAAGRARAVFGHLFTSTWSPRGREPTGALEAAPLTQQAAAYSGR